MLLHPNVQDLLHIKANLYYVLLLIFINLKPLYY